MMNFGDRAPTTICRFPPDAFYHHGKGGCVLDVTQAPFFAKGDGIADDTAALMAAMSFVRSHREVVSRHGKTVCNPKYNSNWIIYLPAGIYSVRDTISQGWPALAMNTRGGWDHVKYFQVSSPQEEVRLRKQPSVDRPFLHGMPELTARDDDHGRFAHGQYNYAEIYSEVNWNIRIFGESRENTIIRLRDETPGFGAGNARSVLSFFLLERGSNINLGNFLENLTIDTGCGNPGAVALRWNSSNWGGVRNVCLRSGDGQGATAMKLDCNNVTGYCRDMVLDGFETGIELAAGRETMLVLEHATIRNMRRGGITVGDAASGGGGDCFDGRRLLFEHTPLGLRTGFAAQGILMDCNFTSVEQEVKTGDGSFLMWRGLHANGRRLPDGCTDKPLCIGQKTMMPLPVKDLPVQSLPYSPQEWVSVEEFGAAGNGRTDDTLAVQKAMKSGAKVVCFTRSNYVINGCVCIPETVCEVIGFFAAIQRTVAADETAKASGIFVVSENSSQPLLVHQFITGGGIFLDHQEPRQVALEDVMVIFNHCRQDAAEDDMLFPSAVPLDTSLWRLYRNSRPDGVRKELFVTDCIGFAGDDGSSDCAIENVTVWGRLIDTEHVRHALYSFRNCDAWIFGFKSENTYTLLRANDGSHVEVLGGTLLNFQKSHQPMLEVADSSVAACFLFWHWQLAPQVFRRDLADGHQWHGLPSKQMPALSQADIAFVFTC